MTLYDDYNLRDGKFYGDMHGENILYSVCRINIKCLILIVWKLATKVFKEEDLRKYFLTENAFWEYKRKIFSINLEATINHMQDFNDPCFDSKFYKVIEELRSSKINEKVDFNLDENFHLSSTYELIEIAKKFNLSDDEKLEWTKTSVYLDVNAVPYLKSVFYELNVCLKIEKDLLPNVCHQMKGTDLVHMFYRNIMTGITLQTDQSSLIFEIFTLFKKRLTETAYRSDVKHIFIYTLETIFSPNHGNPTIEENARAMYKILKSTFSEEGLVEQYFLYFPRFICKHSNDMYEINFLKNGISLYCKILEEKHLKLLMLNESVDKTSNLNRLLCISLEVAKHTLTSLRDAIPNDEKLFEIFNQANMFSFFAQHSDHFKLIFAFYEKHFGSMELKKLINSSEIKNSVLFSNEDTFKIISEFLEEIFDSLSWKKFLNETDDEGQTILHKLALTKNSNFDRINEIAKTQLKKKEYMSLFLDKKDHNKKSINDLRINRNKF